MKKSLLAFIAGTSATVASAYTIPTVVEATMTQATSREVTIAYTLADAPAVVTLDIQTNVTDEAGAVSWVSIGAGNVLKVSAESDVWKKVGSSGAHAITWRPDVHWPNVRIPAGGIRAVVTAWPLDNTPDYMVVDLESDSAETIRYYPSAAHVPGGVKAEAYRLTKLLMRKIPAKNVEWAMGSVWEPGRTTSDVRESSHLAVLDHNYYMGVFEFTQKQYTTVQPVARGGGFQFKGDLLPCNRMTFGSVRCANGSNEWAGSDANSMWPNPPQASSLLGLLRKKTGLDFDLPSEAEWEFACRAGTVDGQWNTGKGIWIQDRTDANLPGCYSKNPGGTIVACGSFDPNAWGLYDMHGNARELCLDWYEADITALGGALNVDPTAPYKTRTGNVTSNDGYLVIRGGSYYDNAEGCRSAARTYAQPWAVNEQNGFRVVCRAGLD